MARSPRSFATKELRKGVRDVTVMTRTRIYEKYHNAEWRNKKLALYQILLSSSAAADRRSCTARRGAARSTGRCAVINRDSMQTTSKMCKAEFFPDESSLPQDTHAHAHRREGCFTSLFPKHCSEHRGCVNRRALILAEMIPYLRAYPGEDARIPPCISCPVLQLQVLINHSRTHHRFVYLLSTAVVSGQRYRKTIEKKGLKLNVKLKKLCVEAIQLVFRAD